MSERIALAQLVADNEIKPGDIVSGLQTVSELDVFVNNLMQGMQGRFGQMTIRQEGAFEKYFSANKPSYFTTARTEEIRVIFLKSDEILPIPIQNRKDIVDDSWIKFMVRANLRLQAVNKRCAYYLPCALFIRQMARPYRQEHLSVITLVRSVIGPRNQDKFADRLNELDDPNGFSRVWLWSIDGSVQLGSSL